MIVWLYDSLFSILYYLFSIIQYSSVQSNLLKKDFYSVRPDYLISNTVSATVNEWKYHFSTLSPFSKASSLISIPSLWIKPGSYKMGPNSFMWISFLSLLHMKLIEDLNGNQYLFMDSFMDMFMFMINFPIATQRYIVFFILIPLLLVLECLLSMFHISKSSSRCSVLIRIRILK